MKHLLLTLLFVLSVVSAQAIDHKGITSEQVGGGFTLIENSVPVSIVADENDLPGIMIAVENLRKDFERVCGTKAELNAVGKKRVVIVGSMESKLIAQLIKKGKLNGKELKGKREKYVMTTVANPMEGVDEALVIAGSDRRGTIYGVYELSEQIGVSPWYDWADVPVVKHQNLSIERGKYTAGEPTVTYRGIFLNDEAPCLTSWVKNTYGTEYGDHRFYARVFELLLRLRANFLWPAMWGWAFYADDPENSKTADEMGIIMGTSHHEPMARNHQEWARHRQENGPWDYDSNQEVIDKFFRDGMERSKNNEDLITIGMRGDGDTALGGKEGHDDEYVSEDEKNLALMRRIIKNQRQIIKEVTGKPAEKRPQVWALYKEVQHLYDIGLRVPDDVIMLLCDDNWGDIRQLPNAQERKHPGGWGMYYHVDYVGAPRNSKWLNVTPVQNLWEQMLLTHRYGVDKLWILNVGDLKPMEYPITLFLNMAWNPDQYTASNLSDHTLNFCAEAFGKEHAKEAARLLNLCCKYNGRSTAEMLDRTVYNLESGEWKQVVDQYKELEVDALRLYLVLPENARDAYQQLILFPVQAMGNIYEMYYAQAMNLKLAAANDPEANLWADKVEACFNRDKELCEGYNKNIANGKWDGMMTQKHIGYTQWNDNFPADRMPRITRVENAERGNGGYIFAAEDGRVVMEAEHFYSATAGEGLKWTVIPDMGRTLSAITLMPYEDAEPKGAHVDYRMAIPEGVKSVKVHVVTKSTLAFRNKKGHSYNVQMDGGESKQVVFNARLNEDPQNIYSVYYPTIARRVVEQVVELPLPASADNMHTLTITPNDPAIVLEKVVVDWGGYQPSYLFMDESPRKRQ